MKKCKDIMTESTHCLSPFDTVQMAAERMKNEDVGSILICEPKTGKLLGIVTDRDITVKITALGLSAATVLEAMTTWSPVYCYEDDDLEKAIKLMAEHQVRRLPVITEGGRLAGIISQGDIATRVEEAKKTESVVKEVSKPASPQYQEAHAE